MTHILRADEGKWITESSFASEQDQMPNFWPEVRTSTPEIFEEVTDSTKTERINAWIEAHSQPEPSQQD